MAHKLLISVKDSVVNNKYIYVEDLSEWDEMLEIKYRRLQVLPPYMDQYVIVNFPQDQSLALTSKNLQLSKGLDDLPDGYYAIHYSVSPNDKVFVDYGHYRVAVLMNAVLSKMAILDANCCNSLDDCGNVELTNQQNTLLHIWMMLMGLQGIAIDSCNTTEADRIYKQAMKEYDRLFNSTCIGC